jgi:hypothetical protein
MERHTIIGQLEYLHNLMQYLSQAGTEFTHLLTTEIKL